MPEYKEQFDELVKYCKAKNAPIPYFVYPKIWNVIAHKIEHSNCPDLEFTGVYAPDVYSTSDYLKNFLPTQGFQIVNIDDWAIVYYRIQEGELFVYITPF